MRILINKEKLEQIQSGDLQDELFANASIAPAALLREILSGPAACYLLSGYRGAGKSTYIGELQRQAKKTASNEIIFVSVDFSRHSKNMNLFRWLIRCLYEGVEQYMVQPSPPNTSQPQKLSKKTMNILRELYGRTFAEVNQTMKSTLNTKSSVETTVDLLKYGLLLGSLISAFFLSLNAWYQWLPIGTALRLLPLGPVLTTLSSWLSIKAGYTKTSSFDSSASLKTLFDDEIADHRFLELLTRLSGEKLKLVFILDEMDKIEHDQLDALLISLKPYLLCGRASFIIVAGQQLYYKYRLTHTENDAILSSLFARVIHISLLTSAELHNLFRQVTRVEFDPNEIETGPLGQEIQQYLTHLLFQSRRIPRSFLLMLRRAVSWSDDGEGVLHLPGHQTTEEQRWFEVVDRLTEEVINSQDLEPGERDYLVVELLINCSRMLRYPESAYTADSFYSLNDQPGPGASPMEGFRQHLLRHLYRYTDRMITNYKAAAQAAPVEPQLIFKSGTSTAGTSEDDWDLVRPLNELRNLAFAISQQLSFIQPAEAATKKFSEVLENLSSRGAFNDSFLLNDAAKSFLDQMHLLMGSPESRKALSASVALHGIEPAELIIPLLTFFSCTRAEQLLSRHGYRPHLESTDAGAIYSLQAVICWKTRLHFRVVLRRGEMVTDRQLWNTVLQEALALTEREFIFLVQFCDKTGLERETLQLQFAELARGLDKDWQWTEKIQLILLEINDLKGLDAGLEAFIRRQIIHEFRYTFADQTPPTGLLERNDAEYPDLLDFRKYRVRIKITPDDSAFWRFGLRFLIDNTRPSRNQPRHSNKHIGDVVACVGEASKLDTGRYEWRNPTQLDLSWHHIQSATLQSDTRLVYDNNPLTIDYMYDPVEDKGLISIALTNSSFSLEREFNMKGYETLLLSAWCDDRPFRLVTDITLKKYVR